MPQDINGALRFQGSVNIFTSRIESRARRFKCFLGAQATAVTKCSALLLRKKQASLTSPVQISLPQSQAPDDRAPCQPKRSQLVHGNNKPMTQSHMIEAKPLRRWADRLVRMLCRSPIFFGVIYLLGGLADSSWRDVKHLTGLDSTPLLEVPLSLIVATAWLACLSVSTRMVIPRRHDLTAQAGACLDWRPRPFSILCYFAIAGSVLAVWGVVLVMFQPVIQAPLLFGSLTSNSLLCAAALFVSRFPLSTAAVIAGRVHGADLSGQTNLVVGAFGCNAWSPPVTAALTAAAAAIVAIATPPAFQLIVLVSACALEHIAFDDLFPGDLAAERKDKPVAH